MVCRTALCADRCLHSGLRAPPRRLCALGVGAVEASLTGRTCGGARRWGGLLVRYPARPHVWRDDSWRGVVPTDDTGVVTFVCVMLASSRRARSSTPSWTSRYKLAVSPSLSVACRRRLTGRATAIQLPTHRQQDGTWQALTSLEEVRTPSARQFRPRRPCGGRPGSKSVRGPRGAGLVGKARVSGAGKRDNVQPKGSRLGYGFTRAAYGAKVAVSTRAPHASAGR